MTALVQLASSGDTTIGSNNGNGNGNNDNNTNTPTDGDCVAAAVLLCSQP